MGFPTTWGQAANVRLSTIARGAVRRAVEQEGAWVAPLPPCRAAVRYSAGYDEATASRMAPADSFGRRILLTAPHFEIRLEPGERWRPRGVTFYRSSADQAARVLKAEWGSDIFTELSPEQARAVTAAILGPLGDG